MTIQEIYQKFDKIGCLTFATVNEIGEPETRIAHLRGYDDDGIYFMTMFIKGFYDQLKENGNVSVCGMAASSQVTHDTNGLPIFEPGYFIQMTGKVQEISMDKIKEKNNPVFDICIKDQIKYPAMVVFCITSARGYVYDYDYDKEFRENKLSRDYFAYNGGKEKYKGLSIDQTKCTSCGICKKKCSFLAVKEESGSYSIDKHRCDECGDCYMNCPSKAITYTR